LCDIPVQYQKRGSTDVIECEKGDSRRIIVGTGLGGGVDDCEDGVAPRGKWKRLVVNKELFSTEERNTRPIDELGQIFLGVDQRVVVLAQIFVKPGAARVPVLMALVPGALRKERVIQRGRMEFLKPVLRVRADVVKEVVRVPARGILANQRLAAVIE
jgi:hypothetical protein